MCRSQLLVFVAIIGLAFGRLAAAQEVSATNLAKHRIELAEPLAAGKSLDEHLEARGTFQAEGATLKSFAAALEATLDTSVLLMTKKLEEAAINTDTPLSYKLKNVRFRTALKLILGEAGLAYVIEDNMLLITTPEDAGSQLVTHVYDCRDLLKMPSSIRRRALLGGGLGGLSQAAKAQAANERGGATPAAPPKGGAKAEDAGHDDDYSADELLEIITTVVNPDSWFDGNGGPIADFKGLIIIAQTEEMHVDIEKLLNQLHKACGLEGKVKVFR